MGWDIYNATRLPQIFWYYVEGGGIRLDLSFISWWFGDWDLKGVGENNREEDALNWDRQSEGSTDTDSYQINEYEGFVIIFGE